MARKKQTGLIGLCVLLIIAVIGVLLSFIIMQQLEKLPILDNVKVAGVDVSGMTVDEATTAVSNAIGNDYATKEITLQLFDETITIPASYSGGTLDVEKPSVLQEISVRLASLPSSMNNGKFWLHPVTMLIWKIICRW